MNKLILLIFAVTWFPAHAGEPKKGAGEQPAEISDPKGGYELSEDEKRLIHYLLGLKKDNVGQTLENELFSDGTVDKPLPPVLVAFQNHKASKRHIYLFRFGKRHIAYAWVDKGGNPIPIPDVDTSTQEESASHYGQGESVTDVEVIDGNGVYILRGANPKWMKRLKE